MAIATPDPSTASTGRRRRKPEHARAEILDAAGALLVDQPLHEVTISSIMGATTLSRKSFYVYFRDRAALLTELVAPMRAETDAAVERWRDSPDSIDAGRRALRHAATLYHRDGAILKALAAASERDTDAAEVWRAVTAPVITVAAEKIAQAVAAGESSGLDPEPAARALVGMNVHYFLERLVGAPATEIDPTVEILAAIWERTIYSHRRGPATAIPV